MLDWKIFDECCFSLVFWKPWVSRDFPGVSGFFGNSGSDPDSSDSCAPNFFYILVECMNCHEHLTITCCTSRAPHCCNTLMFFLFVQNLALKGPLIFKINLHILMASITKVFYIHCLSLVRLKRVVINHQKGGDWRVSCPPKWVLVI
jgi:hypothetical protein